MMKQEERAFWAKELRSGKYKQGKGCLRGADDTYCCLGVLCDYLIRETGDGKWRKSADREKYEFIHNKDVGSSLLLPYSLMHQLDISDSSPNIITGKVPEEMEEETGIKASTWAYSRSSRGKYSLTSLNDQEVPFDIIANLIEKYDVE